MGKQLKQCSMCREWKERVGFCKDMSAKDGLNCYCKVCSRQKRKQWYQNNLERAKALHRKHRMKSYYKYHEKNLQMAKKWREENPEKMKIAKERWRKNNKERVAEYDKEYRAKNRKRVREINLRASLKYHKSHPEVARHAARMRRFLKKNNEGYFTTKEWEGLKKEYHYTCMCCGKKEPRIKIVPDHKMPLSKNGNNNIDNIQPLCGHCNSVKWNKIISLEDLRMLV